MRREMQNEEVVLNSQEYKVANTNLNNTASSNAPTNKPKSKKVRKPQTEEEYLEQKKQFYLEGPIINSENWLLENNITALNVNKKSDRASALHACEKAYFVKDYQKCLEIINNCEKLFGIDSEDINIDGRDVAGKKSKKVEKHVIELLHIKEKCLAKLNKS